jgi:hypothetical protein
MPHPILKAVAIATLLSSFTRGQDISVAASSLDQVAADDFLNATCLADANPGVNTLSTGDTFTVPLNCCGTQSFVCGGAFCKLLAECANLQTGVGSISVTTVASTVTASVTGTMATNTATATNSDGGVTSTVQSTATDSSNTATSMTTSSDTGGAAGGGGVGATTIAISSDAGGDGGGATTITNPGTTTTATDSTQGSSSTQTNSSSSSSGTPTPTAWLLSTKRNTARSDFDSLIKTFPDQGQGNVIAYDNIPWQSYVTKNLTSDQADMIRMSPIVDFIGQVTEEDGEAGVAAASTGQRRVTKPRIIKRETSPRVGSDYHLGILSAPRALMDTTMWPDYEFDTRLGQGQTIYIIDSGYRSTHEVRTAMIQIVATTNSRYRNLQQQVGLWMIMWFPMLSPLKLRLSSVTKTRYLRKI